MSAALVHRRRDGGEQTFATAEGVARQGIASGGLPGDMNMTLVAPAVDSTCGDKLVLKLEFLSGASPYREVYVKLLTP